MGMRQKVGCETIEDLGRMELKKAYGLILEKLKILVSCLLCL